MQNSLEIVDGADLGSCADPGDLGSQIVDLSSGERRVTDNWGIQISGEELLDLSSAHNLCGCDRRQFHPLSSGLVTDEIGLLVAACAVLLLGDDWGRFVVWLGDVVFFSLFWFGVLVLFGLFLLSFSFFSLLLVLSSLSVLNLEGGCEEWWKRV